MKKVLKIIGIVLLSIVALIVLIAGGLMLKNHIDSRRPWLPDDYYTEFQSNAILEEKFAGLGPYEVSNTVIESEDSAIQNIRIWYPAEIQSGSGKYPLIIVVNASNMAALNYEPFFKRLASWGLIAAGNDDRQTGTGLSASRTLDDILTLNTDSASKLYGKIDEDAIGIVGYSQGGAGSIRAVTEYNNSDRYKAIFTGSAAYAHLALMWGGYDASKVSIPWFMTAGTGKSDDAGAADITKEFGGVAPLSSLIENYNSMTDDVFKLKARVSGAEHEAMQIMTDGYMTAWMLYHLQGNSEAAGVFVGEGAEILGNSGWQDVEKNG